VRGAGKVTVLSGALPILAAWIAGIYGLPAAYRPVSDVLAEVAGILLVVLAWRFRRGRLAAAALLIALANLLLRGPLADAFSGPGRPLLAICLATTLALLALLPERPMARPQSLILMTAVGLESMVVAWVGTHAVGRGNGDVGSAIIDFLTAPDLGRMVFLLGFAFTGLAFAARRGVFEGSLLWVQAAAALAVLASPEPHAATLACISAQLVLLAGLVEDSYRLAYHDELTGLPGRRALEEALTNLVEGFAIAMVDIDHFKRFNDRHGHAAGDQALRMVASELDKVKAGGRAYRYGGEEFAVLFPETSLETARAALEDVRRAIAGRRFALRAPDRPNRKPERPKRPTRPIRHINLTVSMGLAAPTSSARSPDATLRAADRALYRAKDDGRNRLVAVGERWRKTTV
jgi:diguanylate cyclase (GGDEF)-like protein